MGKADNYYDAALELDSINNTIEDIVSAYRLVSLEVNAPARSAEEDAKYFVIGLLFQELARVSSDLQAVSQQLTELHRSQQLQSEQVAATRQAAPAEV